MCAQPGVVALAVFGIQYPNCFLAATEKRNLFEADHSNFQAQSLVTVSRLRRSYEGL
jgi:hypothetical protein